MGALILFGGMFDPLHAGHAAMIRYALDQIPESRGILIPTGMPPHKAAAGASARQRFGMCAAFAAGDARLGVTDFECRSVVSYSVDTVRYFRGLVGGDDLYFLVGSDAFFQFHTWREWRKIFRLCKVVVVRRSDVPESEYERYASDFLGEPFGWLPPRHSRPICHSRGGGNPVVYLFTKVMHLARVILLDSRLRGNDRWDRKDGLSGKDGVRILGWVNPVVEISSTRIREGVQRVELVRQWVPESVYAYISREGVYGV